MVLLELLRRREWGGQTPKIINFSKFGIYPAVEVLTDIGQKVKSQIIAVC